MDDCIFCKIVSGGILAKIIYENAHVIAIDDINPVAKVHALIITKKHRDNILSLGADCADELCGVQLAVLEIAKLKGVEESGFRLLTNCGDDGGQSVPHLHFHVVGGQRLGPKLF